MRRHPFLIFLAVVGALIASVIGYIQSRHFAALVKRVAVRHVPADLGVQADFSELSVKLFPPGVALESPRVTVSPSNKLGLPENSRIQARRMELNFQPFQMLTGDIRIHRVVIDGGEVDLNFDREFLARRRAPRKPLTLAMKWEDLVQVRAEGLELRDTRVRLVFADPGIAIEATARSLSADQWLAKGGAGFEIAADLGGLRARWPSGWNLPKALDDLRVRARANAAGLELDELAARADGLDLTVAGGGKGDLITARTLPVEADVRLKADLEKVARLMGLDATGLPAGQAELTGRARADLMRAAETVRGEGTLALDHARYAGWSADRVELQGGWDPTEGGGQVSVARALVRAVERPRAAPAQGGHGGQVEVGAFRWRLAARDAVTIPVKLTGAHIHWLASPVLKKVFPLDFRVSGAVDAEVTPSAPGRPWDVLAKLKLDVHRFRLDNQKLGTAKPPRAVLDFKDDLKLEGPVRLNERGLRPQALSLSMGARSKFSVGGEVDWKKGLDLTATGGAQLEDVGQIAENDIRGKAQLTSHIHGPFSHVLVDFDGRIEDAYYLKMHLGSLESGRITYDDGDNLLLFRDLKVRKQSTPYALDGRIDLTDGVDTVDLKATVSRGQVQEFGDIFRELTSDLWWYPRQLTGPVAGTIAIGGHIDMDRLQVAADLTGTDWDWLGEKIGAVAMSGGYDRGRYHVSSLRLTKRTGTVTGRISVDPERRFDWEFRTDAMTATDLDRVARLDVPLRARVSAATRGKGKEGAIESSSTVAITDLTVRGVPYPSSELTVTTAGGVLKAAGFALGGQGRLESTYDFHPHGGSRVRAELKRLDFSPILLLLNPKTMQDRALTGSVSGLVDLTFPSGALDQASGKLELGEYILAKTGTRFELQRPVATQVNRGTFRIQDLAIRGPQGELRLDLKSEESRLDGSVTGELDVSLVEFFSGAVARAAGTAALDLGIGGRIKEPVVLGKAQLQGAQVRVEALETPFENITGTIELRQNVVHARNIQAELASGRFTAGGTVTLFPDRYPKLALSGQLHGNKVRVYPFQYAKVRGRVNVSGEDIPYLVDGSLIVDSALTREKVLNQPQARSLKSARYMPAPTFRQEGDYPRFRMNLDVVADQGILVQNDLFDAELKGRLTLVNTIEAPRLLGSADLLPGGRMTFKDRVFNIQAGHVEFDNPTVINPRFNLTAVTDVGGTRVQIYSAGRLDKYKIDLTSTPALPESEILSLLALGLTSGEMKRLRAGDRGVFEQGEAASLVLHSLEFNRDVQDKTGLQIDLDESVNTTTGQSIFRPRSETDGAASPKIVIKRQLGERVDVSVGTTVGVGNNTQTQVNAEVKVTPGFSVIGVYDTLQEVDARDPIRSYGVDLKLQKRFK